jgi:hypothetical protein
MAELAREGAGEVHFLIAPQSVLAIARAHGMPPEVVFGELTRFFRANFKTGLVLDIWEGVLQCQQLVLEEYLASKGKTVLCS